MPLPPIKFDVPVAAVLIFGLLLAVAGAALFGLAALARRQNAVQRAGPQRPKPTPDDCARLRIEAGELTAVARSAAAKLSGAVAAAETATTRLAEAQRAREVAGRAYDEAQRAYESAAAAPQVVPRTSDDDLDREVSRAALAAYRRGDLSVDQLREVFRRTGGWDAAQEQRDREVATLRAEAYRAHRAYDAAGNAERLAVKAATIAQVAAEALAEEAAIAADEARGAQAFAEECSRALHGGRRGPGRR